MDEMPNFSAQPTTEEVNAWSRAFRDWQEAQQGYCGLIQNYELERDNCNQMEVDRLALQNALTGWQRRSP